MIMDNLNEIGYEYILVINKKNTCKLNPNLFTGFVVHMLTVI